MTSRWEAFPWKAFQGWRLRRRVQVKLRSRWGMSWRKRRPWLTPEKPPPEPVVARTLRIWGMPRMAASARRTTSSMAVMLVPSGAARVTSNSPSSVLVGVNSWRTKW
jgi:hypothetical protein